MSSGRVLRRLLRLVLGRAAAATSHRWSGDGHAQSRSDEDVLAAARCRRALAEALAERDRRIADLLRYGAARNALIARCEAEPSGPGKEALRRSLATLDERLTERFDQLDALDARITALETDLDYFTATAGETREGGARDSGQRESGAGETPAETALDPELARLLAALGLSAMPATLVELKAAYRSRLKAVHPDVGAQVGGHASTEATAAATVAFAELRKRFVRP